MSRELYAIVSGWNAFELVGVACLWADEVEMALFVNVEDNGLISVVQFGLSAGSSFLVISSDEVIPFILVVEEEVNCAHLGVDSLELGIGVKIDSTGEGVLEFRVVAADLQGSMIVVGIDCDELVELVLTIDLLDCRLDDFPAEFAWGCLALDFEFHLVDAHLAERAELAV